MSIEERLRRLGNAALATPYYSKSVRAGQILGAASLSELPSVSLREVMDHRASFENTKASLPDPEFHNPLPATVKTAIAGVSLKAPSAKLISADQWQWLHNSNTQLLAATVPILRRIVAGVLSSNFNLPHLSHGIIVLNSVEHGTLSSGERDLLWCIFGVPLFEQWLGLGGELLASECEAHYGMHLASDRLSLEQSPEGELVLTSYSNLRTPILRLQTGLTAQILTETCACGLATPRLLDLNRISPDRLSPHQSSPERFLPAGCSQIQTLAAGAA